ncbi:MAG: hypothetical protein H6581_12765 [Bacteroidia bacterium]|nr:hypothetical protein [Bacteroidia bacterium]
MDLKAIVRQQDLGYFSLLVVVAVLCTHFLFFIDEGWYDFRWMNQTGNWVAFFIYAGGLFLGEMAVNTLIPKSYVNPMRLVVVTLLGLPLGLTLLLGLFFGMQ